MAATDPKQTFAAGPTYFRVYGAVVTALLSLQELATMFIAAVTPGEWFVEPNAGQNRERIAVNE